MVDAVMTEPTAAWERLEDSQEWARLSDKQRAFLTVFLATTDSLASAGIVYCPSSKENLRSIAWQTLHKASVIEALDVARGTEHETELTREELISETRRHLRRAQPGSVAADRLLARLERLKKSEQPTTEPLSEISIEDRKPQQKFTVGQIVTQKDSQGIVHHGRVVSVDADGKPTEIETLS